MLCIPRVQEALIINKSEMSNIDRAYKHILKTLLGLHGGTADVAVFMVMGLLPVEADPVSVWWYHPARYFPSLAQIGVEAGCFPMCS